VATLLEQPANPRRVSARLYGDAQPLLLRLKAALEGPRSGAQPALLDHLTAFGIEQTQVGISISQIQPYRHMLRSFATIIHGPILLSELGL
jgi:hypothetical protein